MPGPPAYGEAAGHGDRPVVAAEGAGEPERPQAELHRRREARVEVEPGDGVEVTPAAASAARPAMPIAVDSASDVALGEEVVVVRVGAGVREHHPVGGHARGDGRLVRAEHEHRGLVDVEVGAHALEVGEAHPPVVRRRGRDLLRCPRVA